MPCFAASQAAVSSWRMHGSVGVVGECSSLVQLLNNVMILLPDAMNGTSRLSGPLPTLSPADILFWIWLWALTQAGDDIIVKLRVGSQKTRAGLRYSNHYPASIKTQVRNLTSSDSLCILHLRAIINTNSEVEEKKICCFDFWFSLVNAEPRTLGLSSISIYVKKFNPNHVQTNADKICWKTSSTFPTKFN